MRKFDSTKDYYRVLGVSEDADQGDIDRSYRNRARAQHPDRGGSEEAMKLLNEARDVLGDPETRVAYDRARERELPRTSPRGSSVVLERESEPGSSPLEIPVTNPDLAGLATAAAACIGLGVPFLVLVEMQWVVVLWPLRLLALGALGLGVALAHSALRLMAEQTKMSRPRRMAREAAFWSLVAGGVYSLYYLLYSG